MMRLADRHGRPLSYVLAEYPAWEIPYWRAWMQKEPSGTERIELILAQIASMWASAHARQGATKPKPKDFLFPDQWQAANVRSDIRTLINAFAQANVPVIHKKVH